MKIGKNKNKIFGVILIASFIVSISFFNVALASEISKESVIYLVNKSRTENGLEKLSENEKLDNAAKGKAQDMIKNNYFSHNSPSGVTPWYWFDQSEYEYKYAGENLALGFSTVENQHEAWMNSASHKKNILNSNYKEIGVAVERGEINEKLVTIAVQMFGSRVKNEGNIEKNENNISDEKAQELLEENKKENQGVVLKMEDSHSNDKYNNLFGDSKSEPKINFQQVRNYFENNTGLKNSIRLASLVAIFLCITFNSITIFVLVFHNLSLHIKKNKDMFTVVHGLIALMLIGSIIF